MGGWSIGKNSLVAFALSTPKDAAELYVKSADQAPTKLTDLNAEVLRGKQICEVEPFTFISNDNKEAPQNNLNMFSQ